MSWVALGMGTMTVASSMLDEADENQAIEQKAADYGTREAGINFSSARRLDSMIGEMHALAENTRYGEIAIDRKQAQTEAQIRVNAAAAGVEGGSVNQVIDETEVNAAKAKGVLDNAKTQANQQIKLNFVDEIINTDINKGRLDTSTRTNSDLKHTLSFASGFKSGFDSDTFNMGSKT